MIVTSATLQALNTDFKGTFQDAFKSAQPVFNKIAMDIPSTTDKNVYGFFDEVPGFKEWLGDRELTSLKSSDYTITNKTWQWGITVKVEDMEDDKIGLIKPGIQVAGINSAYHPDVMVFEQLVGGFTNLCYDGKAFFATNHSWKGATYSNKHTLALDATNYQTVRSAQRKRLGGGNNPMMRNFRSTLVAGPALEATVKQILAAEKDAYGADNPNYNSADFMIDEQITSDTQWFLLVTSSPIKPLVYQPRRALKFTDLVGASDEFVVLKNKYFFGADKRDAAGYGLWQLADGSTGA